VRREATHRRADTRLKEAFRVGTPARRRHVSAGANTLQALAEPLGDVVVLNFRCLELPHGQPPTRI